ncbi:MAG: hypothetical protein C3F02_04465 [Parcubacteria group bacterium]|nr:MAG: hypothetical protein C3F02_04465 [Parcubacteria group bacterium]
MLDNKKVTVFAETNYRRSNVKFGIKTDDRRRHMYFIGKTGMGKSTVLENMIIQDIQSGLGVCVVDPHGDLVEKVISFVPTHRINDVIYFNPSDLAYPIAFNVLESVDPEQRHLVVSGLIGVFKKIWADSWGPRLEYVLHHAISALLEYPGSTLLGIMRMLVDKTFRKKVVEKISDPVVKAFWIDEYSKYPDRFQSEAIAPIQNKVGRFLSSALIRNILGQVKSSFSMREIMDQQKILLLNLSKGRVGEDNSALLGAMMITKIQLAAMSRIDTPEIERKDFYLYVDEFQNFATESFANILSEARKYRLNLIIAHQYIEQVEETIQAAVFGNVGTIVVFRIGAADAEYLENEFTPTFTPEDLVNLSKFEVYIKLMIDGVTSEAFSARTLPPVEMPENDSEVREKIISVSRERYAKPREVIEEKITRWSETLLEESAQAQREVSTAGQKKPTLSKPKKHVLTEVNCDFCGKETEINFIPDPTKPIYCKECLSLSKAGKIPAPSSIKVVSGNKRAKESEHFMSLSEAMHIRPNNHPGPATADADDDDDTDIEQTTKLSVPISNPQSSEKSLPRGKIINF